MEQPLPDLATAHRFNHDLLIHEDDQKRAAQIWPNLFPALYHPLLISNFEPYEASAKNFKRIVQWIGTAAVVLTLIALCGSAIDLIVADKSATPFDQFWGKVSRPIECCAIGGLLLALLASRNGPFRHRWLDARMITEIYRQWHFRQLLDWKDISDVAAFVAKRDVEFAALHLRLKGNVQAKLQLLLEVGRDPIGPIREMALPADATLQKELATAYRDLRLDHQLHYMTHKLNLNDSTFCGISNLSLVRATDFLAATSLSAALALSFTTIFHPALGLSLGAIICGVAGVAIRAWRDGFALDEDRQRYKDAQFRLELAATRWESASRNSVRLRLSHEIEAITFDELLAFIRAHDRAQFVM